MTATKKTPVYFIGHGGPNIIYDTAHPVYPHLQKIGHEITTLIKPKAVVVFSAHWQGGKERIEVNTAENTKLIYDFYNFPSHYYRATYPHVGSPSVASRVLDLLHGAGIDAKGVSRGLDHGVWASFTVAFNPETNPLNVPIVQVSLFDSENGKVHLGLGKAVAKLREENILVVASGMAVHNLREFRYGRDGKEIGKPFPYTVSFDEALRVAIEGSPERRDEAMLQLLDRPDARRAHPTFEHLLPAFIAAGAAEGEKGRRLWTLTEGSVSWSQYRFGKV